MIASLYFFFWMPSIRLLNVGTLAVRPDNPLLAPPRALRWAVRLLLASNAWVITSLMLRMEAAIELLSRRSFATDASWSSPRRLLDELNSSILSRFLCTVAWIWNIGVSTSKYKSSMKTGCVSYTSISELMWVVVVNLRESLYNCFLLMRRRWVPFVACTTVKTLAHTINERIELS